MPATAIEILKGWFSSLKKPTQSQFGALIDSFRHKDEAITINDLEANLKAYLLGLGGGSGGGGSVYPTGTQRFAVTDATQAQFTPTIDITSIPVEKICVSNGVRVPFNKVANKIVLDDAAHAGDVVYIDVI